MSEIILAPHAGSDWVRKNMGTVHGQLWGTASSPPTTRRLTEWFTEGVPHRSGNGTGIGCGIGAGSTVGVPVKLIVGSYFVISRCVSFYLTIKYITDTIPWGVIHYFLAIKHATEGSHPGFEAQGRHHQKSKAMVHVSVAPWKTVLKSSNYCVDLEIDHNHAIMNKMEI